MVKQGMRLIGQGVAFGLALLGLWMICRDLVQGENLDMQGWEILGKAGIAAMVGILVALLCRVLQYLQDKRTAAEINDRIREISRGSVLWENSREARRAEWMHWRKRWMLIVYELAAFLIAYMAFVGLHSRSDWRAEILRLEMSHAGLIEEVYDVVWPSMLASMTNKWFFLLFPVVLVGMTFGRRLREKQVPLMHRYHISIRRWYVNSFLTSYLISCGLFLLFLVAQMVGNTLWLDLMEWSDFPFLLRMIGYSLVLMFYLTAVVQMVCALWGEKRGGRWVMVTVLALAFTWLLVQPGAKLAGWILADGNTALMEDLTARNYLLYDVRMEVLSEDYVPVYISFETTVLEAPELVRDWGLWMHGNLILMGAAALAAGYGMLRHRYRNRKKDHEILRNFRLSLVPGEICALVGWEEEPVQSLFRMMSGELRSAGSRITLPENTSGVGFYIGASLYDGLFDAWTNLHRIRLWQGSGSEHGHGSGHRRIEEAMALAGMDRLSRGDNRIIELNNYTAGERVMYGIAAALLDDPQVLVLQGVLEHLEPTEAERIRQTLLRLKKQGITILLACEDVETVAGVADRCITYPVSDGEHEGRKTNG